MGDHSKTTAHFDEAENTENGHSKAKSPTNGLSPMFAPSYSPTWDPKVSVKADYDQYARQPRRNGKNGVNCPKDNVIRPRGSQSSEKQDAVKSLVSSRKSEQSDSKSVDSNERNDINSEGTSKEVGAPGDNDSKRQKEINDPEQARMSVTNLPWNENCSNAENVPEPFLARLDYLPTRKHAKIEQMKLVRVEASENKSTNNSSFLGSTEDKRKLLASNTQDGITAQTGLDNLSFTPPVASVVDFLEEPQFHQRVAVVDKNFMDNVFRSGKIDPAILSRLSAKYMVKYLGQGGEQRAKNVVSSMLVRPLLPPINRGSRNSEKFTYNKLSNIHAEDQLAKSFKAISRKNPLAAIHHYSQDINESNLEQFGDENVEPPKVDVDDMVYHFRRGTRLRKGESKYVYKPMPHHSTAVLGATTDSPREILNVGGEIEDNFDKVVRWKSKMRYCGKPAMYKRITSPTLGEEAIRRKLTDRLPTRQIHKQWPEPSDLYSEQNDKNESWRRPNAAAKAPTLWNTNGVTSFRQPKPSILSTLNQERAVFDTATRHRTVGLTLPPPQLPERKRKPMWQRM